MLPVERHGRPGEAGDALGGAEQAREAAVLGIPVLLAALGDHGTAGVRGQDLLRLVGRGAEHAHGMIVRQHDVLDGLVGDLRTRSMTQAGHQRRRLGVDDDDAVVADDDAAVGVALGGEGVEVAADLGEGDLLLGHVAGGGKVRGHVSVSPWLSSLVAHNLLVDGAEDGAALLVQHLDADAVAELEERRRGLPSSMVSTVRSSARQV